MLGERFNETVLRDLPALAAAAREDAHRDADRLLDLARGDRSRALVLARAYAGAKLWWPYLRTTRILGGNDAPAREAVVAIVLAVDRLAGVEPTDAELREQLRTTLANAFDPAQIKTNLREQTKDGAPLAFLAPAVLPLLDPLKLARLTRRIPPWLLATAAALVVGALASLPLATGASLAHRAEKGAPRRAPSVHPYPNGGHATALDATPVDDTRPPTKA